MAALTNTITAADLAYALDKEFVANFDQSVNQLTELLGIGSIETLAAGTALYQYKVTGALNTDTVAEGDEVPLSKYTQDKTAIGELTIKPYRKLTTAQAILKHGYENAIIKTDEKMIKDARAAIVAEFFAFLATGTGTATGTTFKAALIKADAVLTNALDANNDSSEGRVFLANPLDYGDWAADKDVTNDGTGNVFGMTYIKNLAGINGTALFSSRVPAKSIIATPVENIHLYTPDFGALSQGGLAYMTSDSNTIGVHHEPNYGRTSSETNILMGTKMLAEATNYIVKSTIAPAA